MNAVEIEEAVSELASQTFDAAEFPFLFLEAYGNKSTTIKRLRDGHANKSKLAGAVLQRNNIHIATCAHIPPPKVKQNLYLRGAGASAPRH